MALRIGLEPTSSGSTIRRSAIELPQRKWRAAVRNHSRLPYVVRPPATRRKVRTLAARQYPDFLHKRACLRSSHDMHYPLPLTTDDAGYSHRFAAIPDASRTREAGLAWSDRAQWLGETHCCVPFPPLPTVSSARPLSKIPELTPVNSNLVEDRGVDSLRSPYGRTACVCRRFAPRCEPRASALQRRRSAN